jgi:DNA ligase-associated metallophosphoesterase
MSSRLPVHSDIVLNGTALLADPSGALIWPDEHTLVVADLHLEKGSGFAARGVMLPPYDTRATLDRLESVLRRVRPKRVVCLGDSFHDSAAGGRIAADDAERLRRLAAAHEWIWVAGNHDPVPPVPCGTIVAADLALGRLIFRHAADVADDGTGIIIQEPASPFARVASLAAASSPARRA